MSPVLRPCINIKKNEIDTKETVIAQVSASDSEVLTDTQLISVPNISLENSIDSNTSVENCDENEKSLIENNDIPKEEKISLALQQLLDRKIEKAISVAEISLEEINQNDHKDEDKLPAVFGDIPTGEIIIEDQLDYNMPVTPQVEHLPIRDGVIFSIIPIKSQAIIEPNINNEGVMIDSSQEIDTHVNQTESEKYQPNELVLQEAVVTDVNDSSKIIQTDDSTLASVGVIKDIQAVSSEISESETKIITPVFVNDKNLSTVVESPQLVQSTSPSQSALITEIPVVVPVIDTAIDIPVQVSSNLVAQVSTPVNVLPSTSNSTSESTQLVQSTSPSQSALITEIPVVVPVIDTAIDIPVPVSSNLVAQVATPVNVLPSNNTIQQPQKIHWFDRFFGSSTTSDSSHSV